MRHKVPLVKPTTFVCIQVCELSTQRESNGMIMFEIVHAEIINLMRS